jgi:hypothetical protein
MKEINEIQVDALVLLKLVKHNSSGNLIGVQDDDTLIITNSYQLPATADEAEIANFEEKMAANLNELNYEHQHVGWYQFGKINVEYFKQLLHVQYLQQKADSNMIGLILEKRNNRIDIFGFQLTQEFMKLYEQKTFNSTALANLEDIYFKIKVVVKNSYLINAMQLHVNDAVLDRKIASDESSAIICDELENMIEAVDLLAQETWKWNNLIKNAPKDESATSKKSEPGRYEILMISKQIDSYCSHIDELSMPLTEEEAN